MVSNRRVLFLYKLEINRIERIYRFKRGAVRPPEACLRKPLCGLAIPGRTIAFCGGCPVRRRVLLSFCTMVFLGIPACRRSETLFRKILLTGARIGKFFVKVKPIPSGRPFFRGCGGGWCGIREPAAGPGTLRECLHDC